MAECTCTNCACETEEQCQGGVAPCCCTGEPGCNCGG